MKEKLLPLQMNAFWFTYITVFSYTLLPNLGPELNLLQITGVSISGVLLGNLWALNNEKPIMDERKQELVTECMAWAFIAVTLLLVLTGATGVESSIDLTKDIAEMGLWTWLMVFSAKNLYQRYGSAE